MIDPDIPDAALDFGAGFMQGYGKLRRLDHGPEVRGAAWPIEEGILNLIRKKPLESQ